MTIAFPYGYRTDTNTGHCINVEPGTYGHECGKPAHNIGVSDTGHRAMFCDKCRESGAEAKQITKWCKLAA
jgi:hypothetical protein